MINEKMRTPRPASFRRGSKRFSSASASDVAAMLASGKPPLQRQSTLSRIVQVNPQEASPNLREKSHSEKLDALCNVDQPEEPKRTPSVTWADQASLPIVRGSHGVMNFSGDNAELAVVKTRQQSVVSPYSQGNEEPAWFQTPKLIHRGPEYNNTRPPPPHITAHQRKISRTSPFASPRTPKIANGLGTATMNTSPDSPKLPPNGLAMNHGRTASASSSPRFGSASSTPELLDLHTLEHLAFHLHEHLRLVVVASLHLQD